MASPVVPVQSLESPVGVAVSELPVASPLVPVSSPEEPVQLLHHEVLLVDQELPEP